MCLFSLLDCGRQGWLCHDSAHQHGLAPGVPGNKVQDTQTAMLRGAGASVEEAAGTSAERCARLVWTEGLEIAAGRGSGSQDKDSGSGWAEVGHGHLLLGPEQAGSKCISEAFCLLCHFILDWGGPSSWHWGDTGL